MVTVIKVKGNFITFRVIFTLFLQSECSEPDYRCNDGIICVLEEELCDGEPQCPDGDDEINCEVGKKINAIYSVTSIDCSRTLSALSLNVFGYDDPWCIRNFLIFLIPLQFMQMISISYRTVFSRRTPLQM